MSREHGETKGKGSMASEAWTKMTCDGCGQSRTFVLGKDKRHEHPPWYRIELAVVFGSVGQGELAEDGARVDACSKDCAAKAIAKRLPELPEKLEAYR
jgi:hypothetical protein